MPCEVVSLPGGGIAIICSRGPRGRPVLCQYPECARPGIVLCDAPDGEGGTCDLRCCPRHSKRIASNTDHCWHHAGLVTVTAP